MASLDSLQIRALTAQTTGIRVVDNTAVALRITHLGLNTLPVVTTTANTLVLTDGVGGANVTTITLAAGTATLGRLVDEINATASWQAKVLDGLKSQTLAVASTLVVNAAHTVNTKNGEAGYDVLLNTSVAFTFPIRCTYDRTAGSILPSASHRVKIVSIDYNLNVGLAAAGMVKIYEWDPSTRVETQIWQAASVDTVNTSFDFSNAPITAKDGGDLIVLVTDATAIVAAATNFLQVLYTRE